MLSFGYNYITFSFVLTDPNKRGALLAEWPQSLSFVIVYRMPICHTQYFKHNIAILRYFAPQV